MNKLETLLQQVKEEKERILSDLVSKAEVGDFVRIHNELYVLIQEHPGWTYTLAPISVSFDGRGTIPFLLRMNPDLVEYIELLGKDYSLIGKILSDKAIEYQKMQDDIPF